MTRYDPRNLFSTVILVTAFFEFVLLVWGIWEADWLLVFITLVVSLIFPGLLVPRHLKTISLTASGDTITIKKGSSKTFLVPLSDVKDVRWVNLLGWGVRELRLKTEKGGSNVYWFYVPACFFWQTEWPELVEFGVSKRGGRND